MNKRYFIRQADVVTHFIVIDFTNNAVTSECVDLEEPYNWNDMLDDAEPAKKALKYLEQYLESGPLYCIYYELSEDEFYKTRITLKYNPT